MLSQLAASSVIVGFIYFYVWQPYWSSRAEPNLELVDFGLEALSISNKSDDPVFVLRLLCSLDDNPHLGNEEVIELGESIPANGTAYQERDRSVDLGAGNADLLKLDETVLPRIVREGMRVHFLYLLPNDDQRENPMLIPARMRIHFIWRGVRREQRIQIGAFLYRVEK